MEINENNIEETAPPQPDIESILSETDVESEVQPRRKGDGLMPTSIIGAFLGMLVSTIPAVIGVLLFKTNVHILFAAIPFCIFGGIIIFKGFRDKRALILTIIFTLIGAYLTLASCIAAEYVMSYKMNIFNIPLVTLTKLISPEILKSVTSDIVFPIIFMILGIAVSWEFLRAKKA